MPTNIGQEANAMPDGGEEISRLLGAVVDDLTALRTVVNILVTDMGTRISNHNTLVTKLNSDAGVTDTNYANATAITATAPPALTIQK